MTEPATAEVLEDEVVPETPDSAKPIGVGRFGLLVEHANTFRVNCKIETKPQECLDPSYWEHIAQYLNMGDEVHVMPDDMSWELVLHVQDKGPNWASVIKKAFYELAPSTGDEAIPSVYSIEWAGTTKKFRVLREGKELKSGFATKALAGRFAANHEAAVRR